MGILKKIILKIELIYKTMKPFNRDSAKRMKIWDHKGYYSQITNIFKNSKFYKIK